MNRYYYHILLVAILSTVVLVVNIMAFYLKEVTDYLYIFDLTYAIGNSAHFVALSISDKGIHMKDETSKK